MRRPNQKHETHPVERVGENRTRSAPNGDIQRIGETLARMFYILVGNTVRREPLGALTSVMVYRLEVNHPFSVSGIRFEWTRPYTMCYEAIKASHQPTIGPMVSKSWECHRNSTGITQGYTTRQDVKDVGR